MNKLLLAVLLTISANTLATEPEDPTVNQGNLWQCYPRVCHEPREVDSAPKSDSEVKGAAPYTEAVSAFFWNDSRGKA